MRDGAHNPDGVAWLLRAARRRRLHRLRLDPRRQGRRRDAASARRGRRPLRRDGVVQRALAHAPPRSPSARRRHFALVEAVADPTAAVRRAHALGEPVLVTGSLYLLADLEAAASAMSRRSRMRERITVLTFALVVLVGHRRSRVRRRVYPRQAPSLTLTPCSSPTPSSTPTPGRSPATWPAFFVVVFWLATAFWVFKDARRRIDDPWLVGDGRPARARAAVRRADRLPLPAAARLDRGAPRPRAREPRPRGAPRRARPPLPGLPRPGRRVVPRLPGLHDAAQAGVRLLRLPARADLAGVPVLRDAGAAGRRRSARSVLQPLRVRRTS